MRTPTLLALCSLLLACTCQKKTAPAAPAAPVEKRVREASVAGSFYPDDPAELQSMVKGYLDKVEREAKAPVRMVLAPHAGFVYSGQVAARALKQLDPGFERVVIVAANHSNDANYLGVSVDRVTHFRLPGFEVPISKEAGALLGKQGFGDVPEAHTSHVIEVELPFLRAIRGEKPFEILPLLVGGLDRAQARGIAAELKRLDDGKTAFLFSLDLSHYHPYDEAVQLDRSCLDALERMNADDVARCNTDGTQILVVMTELAALQGFTPRLLEYKNSGDVSGDKSRVVGYGALVYEDRFELTEEEGGALLELARQALEARVRERKEIDVPAQLLARYPRLGIERGAFVTLKKGGELRGCIGTLQAHRSLAQDVVSNAINAAVNDSRFEPVKPEELVAIDLSISVLDAPRPLEGVRGGALVAKLGAERPGLIINYRGRRSTFLPEVWEQLPEPTEFLGHLCTKQGSPADCWRKDEARFESYGAQHLGKE